MNSLVKHFLEFNGLKNSVSTFEHEIRTKVLRNQAKVVDPPKKQAKGSKTKAKNEEDLLSILRVNIVPQNEEELEQMPAIYSKFVEDKILSEQEASEVAPTSS